MAVYGRKIRVTDEQFQHKLKYIRQKTYLDYNDNYIIWKASQGAVQAHGKFLSKVSKTVGEG